MLWSLSTKPFTRQSSADLSLCLHFVIVRLLNTLVQPGWWSIQIKPEQPEQSDTSLMSPQSAQVFTAMLMFCVQLREKERIRKGNRRCTGWAINIHLWSITSAVWTGVWATALSFLCLPLSHCQTLTGTSDLDLPQKKNKLFVLLAL